MPEESAQTPLTDETPPQAAPPEPLCGEAEIADFQTAFPGLAADPAAPGLGLPQGEEIERLLRACAGGLRLKDAYRLVHFESLLYGAGETARQDAVRRLAENAAGSPGSAGGGANAPGLWQMPAGDFAKLVDRARRGELKTL